MINNRNDKVYIILLNYNGWKDTIECLESVLKSDYTNYQIIVVDNASTNQSMNYIINWTQGKQNVIYDDNSQLKYLSQPFEKKPLDYVFYTKDEAYNSKYRRKEIHFDNPLILIQSDVNKGFAAGNNIGIKYALAKNDFEYIWLLNNDTVIEKNSLSSLVKYANKNNLGISGSTLMYYDNPKQVQTYGGHINKFFGIHNNITNKNDIKNELNYISGASFLINKNVINKIGFLPEEYFLYYEETDYCFNARQNGIKLGIDINSIVYHKEGRSTGGSSNPMKKNEFSDILSLRNRIKFHKKYLGGGIGLKLGMLLSFLNRIKRGQFDRIIKIFIKDL